MRLQQEALGTWTRHRRQDERGFSLIELAVGTVVCLIALSAVISSVVQQSKLRRAGEELNLAYLAATNNAEDLRSVPFASLPSYNGVGFDVPTINGDPGGLRPQPGDSDGLPGRFTVTVDQTGGGATIYRVVVDVLWEGSAGKRDLRLETLMGERDQK